MPNKDGTPTYAEQIKERDNRVEADAARIRKLHEEQMEFHRSLEEQGQRDREIQEQRDRQHGGESRSLSASDLMWGILIVAVLIVVF